MAGYGNQGQRRWIEKQSISNQTSASGCFVSTDTNASLRFPKACTPYVGGNLGVNLTDGQEKARFGVYR